MNVRIVRAAAAAAGPARAPAVREGSQVERMEVLVDARCGQAPMIGLAAGAAVGGLGVELVMDAIYANDESVGGAGRSSS